MDLLYVTILTGIITICVVDFLIKDILNRNAGNERMKEISGFIEERAMAFLKKEYS
jgi:K(+)-stimulated pyrophosphate-energized sodium pump